MEDLSPLAYDLGLWIAKWSKDGMAYPVSEDAVLATFSEATSDELAEAIAELEYEGFVSATALIGPKLPRFRPNLDLFVMFDPAAVGSDPMVDAIELANKVLEGHDSVSVPDLHAESGWTLRRFNPALELLVSQIDEDRVSETIDPQYPTRFFFLQPIDRVALRKFAKSE